jgi:hypothetical protein
LLGTGSYAYVQGMPTVVIDPLGLCCAVFDTASSVASTSYDAASYAIDKTHQGA